MRGKVVAAFSLYQVPGITPAYAGKSWQIIRRLKNWQDHPRLCGEKRKSSRCRSSCAGSPPPMRGKDPSGSAGRKAAGITPAYAGKSTQIFGNCFFDQDHPRLCGEKSAYHGWQKAALGSPPPMRGKGASWKCLIDCKGITPAYAGKSLSNLALVGIASGSPPPMRGKVAVSSSSRVMIGITPAYAGKSFLSTSRAFCI